MRLAQVLGGLATAFLCLALPAHAQLFRAYVSSTGSDANPCTLPAPCRLLPAALTAVADGGEIWMLDSANYNSGTVSINKSVSILAEPGAIGSVVASNGSAISISGAGVKVALTNLLVVPLNGTASSGVEMASGASLVIDKVTFSRLPVDGVFVSTAAQVRISNSSFVDIGNYGVYLTGNASGEISNVKMSRMGQFGVVASSASGTTKVAVTDSVVSGAANCGVYSFSSGGQSQVFLTRVVVTASSGGVCSQGGVAALVSLNQSAIHGNGTGVLFSDESAKVATFGNNAIAYNITNISGGTLTAVPLQ
jgi:hypothetical protein